MNIESMIIFAVLFSTIVLSQECSEFSNSWFNYCPQSQSQEIWCYNSTMDNQKIEIRNNIFIIDCKFKELKKDTILCSPVNKIKLLIMTDCQFSNISFKDIVGNKEPNELVIRYTKDKFVNLGLQFEFLSHLVNVSIRNVRSNELFPVGFGKKVHSVQIFSIDGHNFKVFKESFRNLHMLSILQIRNGSLEVLQKKTLHGIHRELVLLDLSWNSIRKIDPETFWNYPTLRWLYLSNNKLKKLETGLFSYLTSLLALRLDGNLLKSIRHGTFSALQYLQVLNISHNPLLILPQEPFGPSSTLNVSAAHCRLRALPALNWETFRDIVLDLSHNYISHVTLPICTKGNVIIKLNSNNILSIVLSTNCRRRNRRPQYFLAGNKPECNCELHNFLNFIRHKGYKPEKVFPDYDQLHCRGSNHSLVNASAPCPKTDCPPVCRCARGRAFCNSKNLTEPPISVPLATTSVMLSNNKITSLKKAELNYWNHVVYLNISNNLLSSLDEWNIPKKLTVLDISNNNLQNLPLTLMQKVEDSDQFKIFVSSNKWRCNCELVIFKEWLMENRDKIIDYEKTLCDLLLDDGSIVTAYVKDAYVDNFCNLMIVDSHIFLILLPIIVLALLVYTYYYKQTVFALLYSWNLLRCSYFNQPIEEKTYDAFICANVADRAIVIECIKKLEPYHRLCIPERDWPKQGKFGISTHVANSLNNSRSTLLIVSEQSLQETWFQVKVRGAYNKRLEDDIHKMILIIVGDVTEVPTKADIREIISSEPCLIWGEKFLWQKLRYELRRPNETFR